MASLPDLQKKQTLTQTQELDEFLKDGRKP